MACRIFPRTSGTDQPGSRHTAMHKSTVCTFRHKKRLFILVLGLPLPHMVGAAQAAVGPGSPGSQPGSCGVDPQENLPQNSHRSFLPIFPTGIFWTPKVSQSPHHDHLCLFHGYNHLSHLTKTIEFCLDLSVVDSCVSVLIPVRWAPN